MNNKKIMVLGCYLGLLTLAACGAPMVVDDDDSVDLSIKYTFVDGTTDDVDLTLKIGEDEEMSWVDDAVVGAQVGDIFTGSLDPEFFFPGEYDENKVQTFAGLVVREVLGLDNPKVGDKVSVENLGDGVIISEGTDEEGYKNYQVDFNDPKSYSDIQYEISVLNIIKQ